QAAAYGKPSVGFANPVIYAAAKSPGYTSDFNDITSGNNFWYLSTTSFPAVPGYDLCTGWGTPAGDNLIDLLAGVSDPLGVAPGRGFVAFGPAEGAFTASTITFSLTNSSASSLNWSLMNTSSWLNVSSYTGALAAHATGHVTVSLNTSADSLPAGTYVGGVVFSNQTSHAVRTRNFVLVAGQNLVQNGDFEEAAYELPYWAQTGGIGFFDEQPYPSYNNDFVDDGTATFYSPYSGNQFFVFGTPGTLGDISENVPTVPGQGYILSFALSDPDGNSGATAEFYADWNGNTIYSSLNPAEFDWSYLTFYLTATSTNTLLQFAARMDNLYGFWGFDDVTLTPIPSFLPNISKAGPDAVALSWNTLAGVPYQAQYTANLLSPNWENITTPAANGATLSVTNAIAGPAAFYRVIVP
ncbi:MAG: BACON domain-containing protein, partial [Limisphaerales bacterium]